VLVDTERDRVPQRALVGTHVGPRERTGVVEWVATDECHARERGIPALRLNTNLAYTQAGRQLRRAPLETRDRLPAAHAHAQHVAGRDPPRLDNARSAERVARQTHVTDSAPPRPPHPRRTHGPHSEPPDRPDREPRGNQHRDHDH
jgi:hypothetical protein